MTALAELAADPHAAYLRLRTQDPVSWLPEAGQWLVTRWHDVLRVLSDPVCFANDHADIHDVFHKAYEPGLTAAEVDTLTRPVARKAADDLFAAGEAELTTEYFERVAAVSGAILLGLGLGCADTLLHWGKTLARDPDADTTEDAAVIVERLRRRPHDSLVARLVHTDTDPVPLLKHLAVSVLKPGWLAAWTLAALWTDRDHFAAVRAHRHRLGAAVYEALRWGGPAGVLTRRTTRAVSLGGRDIPAGQSLAVAVASANRDEAVFPAPHRFDPHREVRPHLGFGVGPRHCPAYPMVIALARTAVDELFERMPNLHLERRWVPAPEGWRLRLPGPVNAVWLS
jgi:cytochrome P450